jgi:hypothetical protein
MLHSIPTPRSCLVLLALLLGVSACASEGADESRSDDLSQSAAAPHVYRGTPAELGNGTVGTYVEMDATGNLEAIGVRFTASMLTDIPSEPDGTAPCFDANGDGVEDPTTECFVMLRRDLHLPAQTSEETTPFGYVQFNYNPKGHPPPAPPVYAVPHFDFHFYIVGEDAVRALRTGTCGFLMDCELYERARVPVPEPYMPPTYIEVGAAAGGEGNHLLPSTAPELADPPADFTETFIFGSFDGHITFYEPMIALSEFTEGVDQCFDIAQAAAWEVAGSYPTKYCIRYLPDEDAYTVSLESFVRREAT